MGQYDEFIQSAMNAGTNFLSTIKNRPLAIVGHFDTDGLCSSALLEQALQRERFFSISFWQCRHLYD